LTDGLDELFDAYRRSNAPGCVVGVSHCGAPIYRAAFGMASIEQGVTNTVATPMPIASVTKSFTCAAVLRLAAEGKLTLEDPIGRWIPELHPEQRRPTLRQLMTHTGGARCYLDHAAFNGYALMPVGVPESIQFRQSELNFAPGTGSSYSNGGYLLLTRAIERAADADFQSVLQKGVLADADLTSTVMPRANGSVDSGAAAAYRLAEEKSSTVWHHARQLTDESFGDGGMISTVDDLLRWSQFLRFSDGPVSLESLAGDGPLPNGLQSQYRHGLIVECWRGLTLVHHAGSLPGASAQLLMAPNEELAVVVLCNRPAPAVDLSLRVLEILLADRLEDPLPSPEATAFDPLLGRYFSQETGTLLGFERRSTQELGLSLFGGLEVPLQTFREGRGCLPFVADVGTGGMLFRAGPKRGRKVQAIEFFDGVGWHAAERIPDAKTADGPTMEESAIYRSLSAAASLRFEHRAGDLLVAFSGEYSAGCYPTEVVGEDLLRFWMPGFSAGMLMRLQRDNGVVSNVVISSSRTRRTVFGLSGG
jgi:D-aminopeptidase